MDVSANTLHSSSSTAGRVAIIGTSGLITDDSDLTFLGSTLTVTDVSAGSLYVTGTVTDASLTASRLVASNSDKQLISNAALTSTRVPFADGTGSLTDDSDMTFSTATLTVTNAIVSTDASINTLYVTGTVTDASLTASLPIFTNAAKQFVSNEITGTSKVVMDTSPTIVGATLSGAIAAGDVSANSLYVTGTIRGVSLNASLPIETDANKYLISGTKTGTGSVYVMQQSPTILDASMDKLKLSGAAGFLVNQIGHTLVAGNVLRHNGTIYVTAQADSATNAEVVGIISSVVDANNFVLTTNGKVTGLSGLTAGTVYFLSTLSAGTLTTDDASVSTQISKPLLVADSTTSGFFANMRGITILAGTNVIQGTTGGMVDMVAEATATLSGSSTNISVAIPGTSTTPVNIIGVQLRVDTAITSGDGATDWGAAFSGGSTSAICASQNFAKQTKVNSMSGGDGVVASTNVNIIAQINGVAGGTFNAGVVRAIVYYKKFVALSDAP